MSGPIRYHVAMPMHAPTSFDRLVNDQEEGYVIVTTFDTEKEAKEYISNGCPDLFCDPQFMWKPGVNKKMASPLLFDLTKEQADVLNHRDYEVARDWIRRDARVVVENHPHGNWTKNTFTPTGALAEAVDSMENRAYPDPSRP